MGEGLRAAVDFGLHNNILKKLWIFYFKRASWKSQKGRKIKKIS